MLTVTTDKFLPLLFQKRFSRPSWDQVFHMVVTYMVNLIF